VQRLGEGLGFDKPSRATIPVCRTTLLDANRLRQPIRQPSSIFYIKALKPRL
jgi:hypothetical protein